MAETLLKSPQTYSTTYPESDGEPMGETGIHTLRILNSMGALRAYFRHRADVYVGANMYLYYTEGVRTDVVAPDLFVVLETHKNERRVWKVWEERKAPDFIIEFTSEATKGNDRWFKRGLYEELGVQEYFQFDPLGEYLEPQLQGYCLTNGLYHPIEPVDIAGGGLKLKSEVLNLWLCHENNDLRFYEVDSGAKLLTQEEAEDELARLRAEVEQLKNRLSGEETNP